METTIKFVPDIISLPYKYEGEVKRITFTKHEKIVSAKGGMIFATAGVEAIDYLGYVKYYPEDSKMHFVLSVKFMPEVFNSDFVACIKDFFGITNNSNLTFELL